jgi:hypothetical protein
MMFAQFGTKFAVIFFKDEKKWSNWWKMEFFIKA